MSGRLSLGPSATLKTMTMILALFGGAAAGAQPPHVSASTPVSPERASVSAPAAKAPADQSGFHDLICKPNGTEDGFDCADEATPAKIVPIPSQSLGPRPQDVAVSG